MWVGSVASAVLTKKGNIYKGICIDTDGSIGMCAERNALSTMLTYGESEIKKWFQYIKMEISFRLAVFAENL